MDPLNQTLADLRASLHLRPRLYHPPTAPEPPLPQVTPQREPTEESPHAHFERQIRAQFPSRGPPASLMDQYPMVFTLAGSKPQDELHTVHEVIVDKEFTFLPPLGRIARRALSSSKLEKLASSITQLTEQAELCEEMKEDSLHMVATMVSETTVWGIVAELRDIMLDIVTGKCSPELLDTVTETFNPNLITQMVSRGAYRPLQFLGMLEAVQQLIDQAAPVCVLRFDYWFEPVKRQLLAGLMAQVDDFPYLAMELLETLTDIKLELANFRFSLHRSAIIRAGVKWEQQMLAHKIQSAAGLTRTAGAIISTVGTLRAEGVPVTGMSVHARLMLDAITQDAWEMPEVFELDAHRIVQWKQRLGMISLASALWTVGQGALVANSIEIRTSLLTQIRCSMFDMCSQSSYVDHEGWALTFFHWLHSAAADQHKAIPMNSNGKARLSTQLITAAHPSSALRVLMDTRILKTLQAREGLGNCRAMAQEERIKVAQCFSIAANELSDVVDSASAVAVHLSELYSAMYIPFLGACTETSTEQIEDASGAVMLREPIMDDDDEDEEPMLEADKEPFQLNFPGLPRLSYVRSSSQSTAKRSSSCGNLTMLQHQKSCGEEIAAEPIQRQRTAELSAAKERQAAP